MSKMHEQLLEQCSALAGHRVASAVIIVAVVVTPGSHTLSPKLIRDQLPEIPVTSFSGQMMVLEFDSDQLCCCPWGAPHGPPVLNPRASNMCCKGRMW